MKRDMELCRRILLELEDTSFGPGTIKVEYDDIPPEDVSYHLKLLDEAGLIEAVDLSSIGRLRWRAKSITWDGHDFIEAIRNDSSWNKAKSFVLENGKILTLETLKEAVKALFM